MSDMKDARYSDVHTTHASGREDLRDRAVPGASLDDWNHEDGQLTAEKTHPRQSRQEWNVRHDRLNETGTNRRPRLTLDEVLRWYGDEY
ncbi:hypothetical protein GCM10010885_10310 [Alicyclobacillus cellulosilyticus]|uniref:Uncharacterized protein n=1 Tax=Alicyclobacillus cellulosilyticus TaxID=1003997 RepID=A0A917NIH0_9BACL|nr:hypothetical protein [Alicyclobacillus cellulosilyticus]GGJ02964.1 hypothetical protein GCM10010885_10310 [Alicyclobacillus cellulosilyticus]